MFLIIIKYIILYIIRRIAIESLLYSNYQKQDILNCILLFANLSFLNKLFVSLKRNHESYFQII